MKNKLALLIIAIVGLMLIGVPKIDREFHEGRWQFSYDALLWTFTIDRIPAGPNEYTGFYLEIPDRYCYKHIGGYTGSVNLSFYSVPGDTNFVIEGLDGTWFGGGGCVRDWVWSTGKLER